MNAIEIRDLFRVYSTPEGDAAALQGLTLDVGEHELVVVLGPSGSGKTTLLQIVAGHVRASAGVVRVFDKDARRLPARDRSRIIGYVDQHYERALAPELTVRELIALPLELRGMPARVAARRVEALLDRVGLADRRDARRAELSGGEQQRIALCAGLAHEPALLLADEPTGELDAANAGRVYHLIGELAREEGCAALIVSHDQASTAIADRVIQIRDGRLAAESGPAGNGASIVVGRGGWLHLPEELLARAGIGSHAVAALEEGRLVVEPVAGEEPAVAPEPRVDGRVRPVAAGAVAELRAVSKRYGSTLVLDGLDASFAAGRLTAVTGPSGSGKTTLLHLVAGLVEPSGGEVVVLGRELSGLDRAERSRLRGGSVGVVSQQSGLVPFLGAQENVELGLALRGRPADERQGPALAALKAVGVEHRAGQRVSRLSSGEQARVALARAVAARPALLLADEPTSRLDEANALEVALLLARLAGELGIAVVCATHDRRVIDQADDEFSLG
ncbi:MAG: ABC transporter ATP-binding protein [Gaiellaceae bacterium]